jgi:hypothetical protein
MSSSDKCIHVVDIFDHFRRIDGNLWESGFWPVPTETARRLVGCSIYFHKKPTVPSFFGGRIVDFRVVEEEDDEHTGMIVFNFEFSAEYRNVPTTRTGWSKDVQVILPPLKKHKK